MHFRWVPFFLSFLAGCLPVGASGGSVDILTLGEPVSLGRFGADGVADGEGAWITTTASAALWWESGAKVAEIPGAGGVTPRYLGGGSFGVGLGRVTKSGVQFLPVENLAQVEPVPEGAISASFSRAYSPKTAVWSANGTEVLVYAVDAPVRGRAGGTADGPMQRLLILDGKTGALKRVLSDHEARTLAAGEQHWAASAKDISVWAAAEDAQRLPFEGTTERTLAWSAGDRYLAAADRKGRLQVYLVESGAVVVARSVEGEGFRSLAFHPEGSLLVAGGEKGVLTVACASSSETMEIPVGSPVRAVGFVEGGRTLVVATKGELWSYPVTQVTCPK